MKLAFGLLGAVLMIAFLSSVVVKVREPAMIVVVLIGFVLMFVDLWQARNEPDS